ncbi:MAG TPA: amidohydrolase [Clostridia bacterium]|nr:amidohydrolase [Clostridia bacterium]
MLFHDIALIGQDGMTMEHRNVRVQDALIASIDPCSTTLDEARMQDSEVYDGRGKLIIPGFFNNHSHIPMTLTRGYGEGLSLYDWLYKRIFPFEALLTEEDVYWGAMLGIAEMLRGGTVSFTDMYMRIQGIYRAVMDAGIKGSLANGLTGDATTKLEQTAWYRETETMCRDADTSGGLVIANASLHAQYTSAPELVRQIAEYAKDRQLRMHIHLSETAEEHEECKEKYGKTPTRYFTDLGLFDVPTTAAHAIFIEEEDYDLLRDKGVTLCHMPSSNLKIGSGLADVKKWRDHGIRVTIGTDGAGSNNNLDMIEEVTLASYLAKGIHRDPLLFSTGELLTFSTRNGALAQGRQDTGLLEPGYRADLAVVDMTALHFQPVYDIGTSLFTNANASDVALTMVDGRVLYKDGEFTTIDIEKVLWNVYRIRDEKLAALSE